MASASAPHLGEDPTPAATGLPTLAVYICTFRRNEMLHAAIESLAVTGERGADVARLGVVVVDDNPDGSARSVAERFEGRFPLGIHYTHVGARNIATARNRGIATSLELADWVGMVDDDEVVDPDWLREIFRVQVETGADIVTGPVRIDYRDDAPRFLRERQLADLFEAPAEPDGAAVEHASTGNSMFRASWLRDHPDHRFREDLGTSGGEDMVFYRSAIAAGLRAHYAPGASAHEVAPPERSTTAYVMRRAFWMGNTSAVTLIETGTFGRGRLVLGAGKKVISALVEPMGELVRGRRPRPHRILARVLFGAGMLTGVAGKRMRHR